jgi:hypothetical protein
MRALVRIACIAYAIVVARSGMCGAQSLFGVRAGVPQRVVGDSNSALTADVPARRGSIARLRPYAGLTSLVVPGSGQFLLGKDRFIGFLAVEMLGWWQYSKDIRERAAQERAYKDYARRVARAPFSSTFPDGPWEYYEAMRDFKESGASA